MKVKTNKLTGAAEVARQFMLDTKACGVTA